MKFYSLYLISVALVWRAHLTKAAPTDDGTVYVHIGRRNNTAGGTAPTTAAPHEHASTAGRTGGGGSTAGSGCNGEQEETLFGGNS